MGKNHASQYANFGSLHIDDTHWATIASETVGNIIADKIEKSTD